MLLRLVVVMLIVLLATASPGTLAVAQQGSATPAVDDGPPQPAIEFLPSGTAQGGAFDAELQPGEEASFAVSIGNIGQVGFEFVTYAADAYTIRNGGFSLLELDSTQTGPTTWLDFPTEYFFLAAGEFREQQFTLRVPEDAPPGEYVTGIAMQTAEPVNAPDEGIFRYDQYYRSVIGIRIVVPGALEASLEIGEPFIVEEGGIPGVVVPVTNTGNRQTAPAGEVQVFSATNELVLSAPVQMGAIYGGHRTELWLGLSSPLPEGDYTLSLTLSDPNRNVHVEVSEVPLTVTMETQVEVSPVSIVSASLVPLPSADNVQFANVEAVISNTGEPIANAQLSLIARVDGVEVERFPISQALSLVTGDTPISTRYIPATGWTSGEWTFELLLETVEPSGAAVVVDRLAIDGTITIP